MKKIILSLLLSAVVCIAYGQVPETICTISGDNIATQSKFIDAFNVYGNPTPYVLIKAETIVPSSSYGSFSLRLSKFNGYENEPGICNVIELLKNGTPILTLKSGDGFDNIDATHDYIFTTLKTDETYALVFAEYIYASEPSMTSIVLIHKGQAQLVYNKRMYFLDAANILPHVFSLRFEADTVEYNSSGVAVGTPEFHTLWWDGLNSSLKIMKTGKVSVVPGYGSGGGEE